ncbi:hypothetical protein GV829_01970 [Sphingomonas lacunae]|uniref:UrcA family protein n=1 Tax=Sphingomonas lacunae TaxID=2698828 RepID=A0A6M4ASQ7_9SPHN|nr:hypothetical protein [Sphingomonas lacunae]QJQ31362.1 hypothetical protein GV829_01970 [Sphingomonas lacunae]
MKSFPLSLAMIAAAFTLAPLVLVSTPAAAQGNGDYRCTALPAQVQAAVSTATDADQIQRAQRFLQSGNQLCEARAEGAAARAYRSALRILGASEVRTTAPTDIAQR